MDWRLVRILRQQCIDAFQQLRDAVHLGNEIHPDECAERVGVQVGVHREQNDWSFR